MAHRRPPCSGWTKPDGEIWLNPAAGRVKVANIRCDPRVSVSLHSQRDAYTYVTVSGRARLEENHAEDVIDSPAKKFTNQDKFAAESRGPMSAGLPSGSSRNASTAMATRGTPVRLA